MCIKKSVRVKDQWAYPVKSAGMQTVLLGYKRDEDARWNTNGISGILLGQASERRRRQDQCAAGAEGVGAWLSLIHI